MKRHAMSKYFGNGAGHVLRQHNSAVLLFSWHGKARRIGPLCRARQTWRAP